MGDVALPRLRADLNGIPIYSPGAALASVAAGLGITEIACLASNESPTEPFPEVLKVIREAARGVNRYPDTGATDLTKLLAERHSVPVDGVWVTPGSTGGLISVALAVGGPGTSAVFADPSFLVYRMATLLAGAEPIGVPLDAEWRHDPEALAAAIRPDTNVVYYCNPNNPTGTYTPAGDLERFVAAVPDRVTIVIDEAYFEYVIAPDYATAVPLVGRRDNVIVTRTFSKVFGLAGMRIGYAVGHPDTIASLRRVQPPFATTTLAQAAASEALRHDDLVAERVRMNSAERDHLTGELTALGQQVISSQTNFVLWKPSSDPTDVAHALLQRGVMVRPMGPWLRITVGAEAENRLCVEAISDVT